MEQLTAADFESYFRELYDDNPPFPWQQRLLQRMTEGAWPAVLDLPTASGKTACLDVAVFAMALRQQGPRRVFFVVDRRVVVDAAYERMQKIAKGLGEARVGVLKTVADRLRSMSGDDTLRPLDTYQLRGGIYRDDSWVRSPLQPTLIAGTVDQVGSRLLFRGYGLGENIWPIHAGLIANDSLVLLDEAHCSRPFSETLVSVQRYRDGAWATKPIDVPFAFVEMTATPVRHDAERFGLEREDHEDATLRRRLYAPKAVRAEVSKARPNDAEKLADDLVKQALSLAEKPGFCRIAVMVNRVRTARLVYQQLRENNCNAHLLIGRMRPVDREALPTDIAGMLSGKPRIPGMPPLFVVATQCLEVGADLDFDAIVTECASIDALLQRFGRLDRIGNLQASGTTSEGRVIASSTMDSKYNDAVYGEALTRTWQWLTENGEELDFGICSDNGNATVRERLQLIGDAADVMRRYSPPAPALLPAHLDVLVQTSPRPALEPDIALYLHGLEGGLPDVQVVWRADLRLANPELWAEIVALCPPVSAEAMTVPLHAFRAWLLKQGNEDAQSSDIEGVEQEGDADEQGERRCPVLRWRGDESTLVEKASDVRPGDTLMLAQESGGWNELGHIPPGAEIDVAERARLTLRRGWVLRLHPALLKPREHGGGWPQNEALSRVKELVEAPELEAKELAQSLLDYRDKLIDDSTPNWLIQMLGTIPRKATLEAYPTTGDTPAAGWIFSGNFTEADAGEDESSAAPQPVLLDKHLEDVLEDAGAFARAAVADDGIRQSVERAAKLHDCGKADIRFQALLRGGDPMAAQFAPKLLAKGALPHQGKSAYFAQRQRSGLPEGFRHELVSLLLARRDEETNADELALHLIASHHGRCRPFAPVIPDVGGALNYAGLSITQRQREEEAAHRLDSGVADRFWKLTRRYGWWGLAYIEALLRLGDWRASKKEIEPQESRP